MSIPEADPKTMQPAGSREAFIEAAWENFPHGEGKTTKIYIEGGGYLNPTVGVGHLVMPYKSIDDQKIIDAYRKQYLALNLIDANGKPLSAEAKGRQFDDLIGAMKVLKEKRKKGNENKQISVTYKGKTYTQPMTYSSTFPYYITYPPLGELKNRDEIRNIFNKDIKSWYNTTRNLFKEEGSDKNPFDEYPLSLQLALVHACYGGRRAFVSTLKGKEPDEIAELLYQKYQKVGTSAGIMNTAVQAVADTLAVKACLTPQFDEQFPKVVEEQTATPITDDFLDQYNNSGKSKSSEQRLTDQMIYVYQDPQPYTGNHQNSNSSASDVKQTGKSVAVNTSATTRNLDIKDKQITWCINAIPRNFQNKLKEMGLLDKNAKFMDSKTLGKYLQSLNLSEEQYQDLTEWSNDVRARRNDFINATRKSKSASK